MKTVARLLINLDPLADNAISTGSKKDFEVLFSTNTAVGLKLSLAGRPAIGLAFPLATMKTTTYVGYVQSMIFALKVEFEAGGGLSELVSRLAERFQAAVPKGGPKEGGLLHSATST